MKYQYEPSLLSIVLTVVTAGWILHDISLHFLLDLLNPLVLLALVLALIPIVEHLFIQFLNSLHNSEDSQHAPLLKGAQWRWCVLPVTSALVLMAVLTGWPMHLRFLVSKPAFERTVAKLRHGEDIGDKPTWIGAFPVRSVMKQDDGVVYFTTGRAITDPVGITYDPTRPPTRPWSSRLRHNWYGGGTF